MDGWMDMYICNAHISEYSTCADLVTNIIDSSGLEVKAYNMIVLNSLYTFCLRIK